MDHCSLANIPKCIKDVLNTGAWKVRFEAGHLFKHDRFLDFVTSDPLVGCGWDPEYVKALIEKSGDAEALTLWRQAVTPLVGTNQHTKGTYNVSILHGNSRAYTLDRLKREREDLYNRVVAGELSANAAAIEAGFRKTPTPYEQILRLFCKLAPDERVTLVNRLMGSLKNLTTSEKSHNQPRCKNRDF